MFSSHLTFDVRSPTLVAVILVIYNVHKRNLAQVFQNHRERDIPHVLIIRASFRESIPSFCFILMRRKKARHIVTSGDMPSSICLHYVLHLHRRVQEVVLLALEARSEKVLTHIHFIVAEVAAR